MSMREEDRRTHVFDRRHFTYREICYRDAMVNLLLHRVIWLEGCGWPEIPALPPDDRIRIGLVEEQEPGRSLTNPWIREFEMRHASQPLVIVHDYDDDLFMLLTPFEAALWPARTVTRFTGLAEFLKSHVDVARPFCNWVDGGCRPPDPEANSWLVRAGWRESNGMEYMDPEKEWQP